MGAFAPYGFFFGADAFVDNDFALANAAVGRSIEFDYTDCAVAGIFGSAVGSVVVVDDVGLTVFVEEECRVDALYFGKHYGVTPFACRILSLDKEIA